MLTPGIEADSLYRKITRYPAICYLNFLLQEQNMNDNSYDAAVANDSCVLLKKECSPKLF
jgi:hypothetical protein